MKYIKLFESIDRIKDELEDSFASIYDLIGKPHITKKLYDKEKMNHIFTFKWKLGYDLSNSNDISILNNLHILIEELKNSTHDAKSRLGNLDFKIEFHSDWISLNIIPAGISSNKYNFILGLEWRTLALSKVEIIRYFKNKNIDVTKFEDIYNEAYETSELRITLPNDQYIDDFTDLLNKELEEKEIDFKIYSDFDGLVLSLTSDEKRHIELS